MRPDCHLGFHASFKFCLECTGRGGGGGGGQCVMHIYTRRFSAHCVNMFTFAGQR